MSDEDQVVQAKDDASPTKWHLAHTTWFFEAFVLKAFLEGYRIFDERFEYCFNSYYESVGCPAAARQAGSADAPVGATRCAPIASMSMRHSSGFASVALSPGRLS